MLLREFKKLKNLKKGKFLHSGMDMLQRILEILSKAKNVKKLHALVLGASGATGKELVDIVGRLKF